MRIDHPTFVSMLALGLASTTVVMVGVAQVSSGVGALDAAAYHRRQALELDAQARRLEQTVDALEEELELARAREEAAERALADAARSEPRTRWRLTECGVEPMRLTLDLR